jgi:predicted nuclease of predicted toxin-antitoxin system
VTFFLDHDVNDAVADALRRHGHEAMVLRDVAAPETNDVVVFTKAQDSGCLMITCNRNDYLELAARQSHHGLINPDSSSRARTSCA